MTSTTMRVQNNGASLEVYLVTKDLELRSVREDDIPSYQSLYSDPKTMQKFVDNEFRLAQKGEEEWKKEQIEAVAKRVTMWVKRWKEGIPFSALAVYRGKDFIGHVVAGYGENPGETEIAYIIRAEDWSKGYGSQAVEAVVQKWIPYLQQLGCLVEADNGEKHVVSTVVATSRKDNGPSNRILQKNGFHQIGQKEAYGLIRCVHQKKL